MEQSDRGFDDIYRPPQADLTAPSVEESEEPASLVGAGFGIRMLARIIDTTLSYVIGFFMGTLLFIVALATGAIAGPEGWDAAVADTGVLDYAAGALGIVLYHSTTEYLGGASLGKLICGLRVVHERMQPPPLGGVVIRNLGYFVDAFFFGLVAWSAMRESPRSQRYGDRWGHTMVLKRQAVPARARLGAGRLLLGLLLGSLLWAACLSLPIVLAVFVA